MTIEGSVPAPIYVTGEVVQPEGLLQRQLRTRADPVAIQTSPGTVGGAWSSACGGLDSSLGRLDTLADGW